jgi:hypothetical protein
MVGVGFDGNHAWRLFAEHFGHDKNQNRAAKSASQEKVDQRIAGGGEHGSH